MTSQTFRRSGLAPTEAALQRAWNTASKTWIVALPATLASLAWAATVAVVGGGDGASDAAIAISFFVLLSSTVCAVSWTTLLASAPPETPAASAAWRIGATIVTVLALSLIGALVAFALRSFFVTWFICAFLFIYAVPMAATGRHGWSSLFASARLAVHRLRGTVTAAIAAEVIAALAFALSSLLSEAPVVGTFLQSLAIQLTLGFLSLFALNVFRNEVPNAG